MFDEFEDDFLEFDKIPPHCQLSSRPDLHAFILLHQLVPGTHDMVSAAEHDEIYLSVSAEELKKVATPEQLRDLHRCGVRYDSGTDSLALFV